MKNIITLFLFALSFNCKAQSPVIDIMNLQQKIQDIPGAYHKDTQNLLNPFEGTYLYTNGNTSFKIVFQKKIMSSRSNGYLFEDLLIGEYQYIENGLEKVNTLPKLNINYSNKHKHSISTNHIIMPGNVGCEDCVAGEKALYGGLVDGASDNTARFIIRRITVNGQPAIKVHIGWRYREHVVGTPEGPHASIPGGDYVLIKQN
ncbi:hypothetical protein GV828_01385 [Flavobacterium sp. NST-5]|uniref:DUF6705 domain-containing protein n=1 Tax=Flavobacterium ichthyis TaxID=2698827 RepID=A0ABW9Z4T2_9FLAO|nr:DUF6705 family protein [Flavobacterium ichthyis]NBL63846.1 hypothetical protein [Flavobacterium ichthyis]